MQQQCVFAHLWIHTDVTARVNSIFALSLSLPPSFPSFLSLKLLSPHQFPYAPTAWSECRRLALEFLELSSAILSGHAPLTVQPSPSEGVLAAGWGERVGGGHVVAAVSYLRKPV